MDNQQKKVLALVGGGVVIGGVAWLMTRSGAGAKPQPGLASVAGVVVDIDADPRQPVPGVSVAIGSQGTQSDGDGRYFINNVVPGQVSITATKTGYQNRILSVIISEGENTEINITMTKRMVPDTIFSGKVVDYQHNPITGALVTVLNFTQTTDTGGGFEFHNLSYGYNPIKVAADGYEPYESDRLLEDGKDNYYEIMLTRITVSGKLFGVVRNSVTKAPLVDATVRAGEYVQSTGSDGRYEFEYLAEGTYTVGVFAYMYRDMYIPNTHIGAGGTMLNVDLEPIPPPPTYNANITGKVTDETTHNPVEGAVVQVGSFSNYTNPLGIYSMESRPTGTWPLIVQRAGYLPYNNSITVSPGSNVRDIVLTPETPPPPPPPQTAAKIIFTQLDITGMNGQPFEAVGNDGVAFAAMEEPISVDSLGPGKVSLSMIDKTLRQQEYPGNHPLDPLALEFYLIFEQNGIRVGPGYRGLVSLPPFTATLPAALSVSLSGLWARGSWTQGYYDVLIPFVGGYGANGLIGTIPGLTFRIKNALYCSSSGSV